MIRETRFESRSESNDSRLKPRFDQMTRETRFESPFCLNQMTRKTRFEASFDLND